jgi:prepilin-type N-terminal cleavage/methylation domain-containing protein
MTLKRNAANARNLRKGFSLLEMMIVVVLLAGILAIAWPSIARPMRKAELSEATQKLREAIEDGRYQAMMTGAPVFLHIQQGENELRSGGIDSLIAGELAPSRRDDTSASIPQDTTSIPTLKRSPLESSLNGDESNAVSGVTPRTWKLPSNIVVFSVAWLDELAGGSTDNSFSVSTSDEDERSDSPFPGSTESSSTGSDALVASSDGDDQSISGHSWCLPMSAEGRGRDAEITLFDTKARQTITVSFSAATGELEVIR